MDNNSVICVHLVIKCFYIKVLSQNGGLEPHVTIIQSYKFRLVQDESQICLEVVKVFSFMCCNTPNPNKMGSEICTAGESLRAT